MEDNEDKKPVKKVIKKVLPKAPSIYEDGDINMHSSMIRDEESFCKLWKRSSKQNLKQAYEKASKWREKYAK